MAADRVKEFWTAIVSFFCGLLASLRAAAPAACVASVAGRRGGSASPAVPVASAGAVALPAQRAAGAGVRAPARGGLGAAGRGKGAVAGRARRVERDRALPPTIKQRIRAEAHGASPAVRRPAAAGALAACHPGDPADPAAPAADRASDAASDATTGPARPGNPAAGGARAEAGVGPVHAGAAAGRWSPAAPAA
ncbi:DUF6344 domain-containing protein [Streptomyces fradiae]|uniref:DUF6344 domain-containing protein n=1 Tax=Streptomyces fradiae TaxID=1906 RepID=UPI00294335A9|nr:DUF6344 domain-containing protein [Streptomyces fradiae]WOI58472.1 DUF6344 domain-containing protein [Streptomyces fradiae]